MLSVQRTLQNWKSIMSNTKTSTVLPVHCGDLSTILAVHPAMKNSLSIISFPSPRQVHSPDSTMMSSSAIHVSPSLELISASRLASSRSGFTRFVLWDCRPRSEAAGWPVSSSPWPRPVSESVSLGAELLSFLRALDCLGFLLRLILARFSPPLLLLSPAPEPIERRFFLSFLRSALPAAWLL